MPLPASNASSSFSGLIFPLKISESSALGRLVCDILKLALKILRAFFGHFFSHWSASWRSFREFLLNHIFYRRLVRLTLIRALPADQFPGSSTALDGAFTPIRAGSYGVDASLYSEAIGNWACLLLTRGANLDGGLRELAWQVDHEKKKDEYKSLVHEPPGPESGLP